MFGSILRSWWGSDAALSAYEHVLLTIGSGRTGSTVLGQILNHHPNCFMATEARFLSRIVQHRVPIGQALQDLLANAQGMLETGLECHVHYSTTLAQWQRQWSSLGDLRRFPKNEIRVVGDKKSGGNTDVYLQDPDVTREFLMRHTNIRLLQVFRHPVSAAHSLNRALPGRKFAEACRYVVKYMLAGHELGSSLPESRYLFVFYEDLLESPADVLREILDWLGLSQPPGWAAEAARVLSPRAAPPGDPLELAIARRAIAVPYGELLREKYFPAVMAKGTAV